MSLHYVIHADGLVTLDGEAVGALVTGDDGLAYVEFFESHICPPGQHWFGNREPPNVT